MDKVNSSRENPVAVEVGQVGEPASAIQDSETTVRQLAARLDTLVGEFVSLHMAMLRRPGGSGTCEEALTALFSNPILAGTEATVKAYTDIVPGVQIGFEPTGTVLLTVKSKQDFSRSPDSCLNTITVSFSGTSRWLTLELAISWEEFRDATRYQLGLYAQPDRSLTGQAVLRLPLKAGGTVDHRLAEFRLSELGRNCNRGGVLALPDPSETDPAGKPRLILFFDSKSNLVLRFDYLAIYFA